MQTSYDQTKLLDGTMGILVTSTNTFTVDQAHQEIADLMQQFNQCNGTLSGLQQQVDAYTKNASDIKSRIDSLNSLIMGIQISPIAIVPATVDITP